MAQDSLPDPNAVARVRARLRQAGLLAEFSPIVEDPPDPVELARARKQLGRGTPLSDIVIADRA